MTKEHVLRSIARTNAVVVASVLSLSALVPVLMQGRADAATVENRYIDMSSITSSSPASPSAGSGAAGGTNVTYTVGFDMPADGNVGAIVVEFCSNVAGGPIVLESCTAPAGFDVDTSSAVANQNGITGFTKITDGIVNSANRFAIENATPQLITSNTADTTTVDGRTKALSDVKFDVTGITNPSATGTFYARIIVYATNTNLPSTSWVSTSTDGTNGIGTRAHDGGIALSTANQLTVTARVQEVLEFCIGTDDDSQTAGLAGGPGARIAANSCVNVDGTDIDLGVVESSTIQRTSDSDIGTSGNDGVAMIRTNGIDGAAVFYKAEQESGITNGAGTLRQAGIDDCTTLTAVNNACFNSAGGGSTNPTKTAITNGTENFGMTLTNLDRSAGGATTALSCNTNYNGDGSCGAAAPTGYAWDPTGAFDTIASSNGPLDDEMVNIEFAATASPTTPTGLYTVTANFVATSQF